MGPHKEPDVQCTQIFINNEWVDAINGKTFFTVNPANGEKMYEVQEGDKDDVNAAVEAAKEAFKIGSRWRTMDASLRAILMHKLCNLLERDIEYLASLDTICCGKVYKEALMEMHIAIGTLRYYAGWPDKISGKTIPADGNAMVITRNEPVGVVGLIIPWNLPMYLLALKLGPALAVGCTCVVKPAEQTPLGTLYIAQLIKEAGFPPGVVNVVPGYGEAGEALTTHWDVDKVSFTGSTEVGQLIQRRAGESNSKRVTLEMGGKSPLVICADADIDEAVKIANNAVFFLQGQACCAGTRTYVHEDIYDEFVAKSKELAESRVLGDPFDEETMQGPQVDKDQWEKILGLIESGKEQGAIVECGGEAWGENGYYIQPTVFSNVEDHMSIAQEEIFGPVQSIFKFKTLNEVIDRCNDSKYGLAAGIFSNNIKTALMFAQGVKAGTVWINTYFQICYQAPFGGYKLSGFGREGGYEGLLPYMEFKTVSIKIPQKNS